MTWWLAEQKYHTVSNQCSARLQFAIKKKKKKRSNDAIVISSKCTMAMCNLRQHYVVEIHALSSLVHSVYTVYYMEV